MIVLCWKSKIIILYKAAFASGNVKVFIYTKILMLPATHAKLKNYYKFSQIDDYF